MAQGGLSSAERAKLRLLTAYLTRVTTDASCFPDRIRSVRSLVVVCPHCFNCFTCWHRWMERISAVFWLNFGAHATCCCLEFYLCPHQAGLGLPGPGSRNRDVAKSLRREKREKTVLCSFRQVGPMRETIWLI